jgi:hypothetical protein
MNRHLIFFISSLLIVLSIQINSSIGKSNTGILTSTTANQNKHSFTLDTTIFIYADLTYDGLPDTIIYSLKAIDWDSTVVWSIKVVSKKDTIFKYLSNDRPINELFSDPGFVDNCSGYLMCKRQYYLFDIPKDLIKNLWPNGLISLFDCEYPGCMYNTTYDYYTHKLNYQDSTAAKLSKNLIKKIKNFKTKDVRYLNILHSPVETFEIYIYDYQTNKMIPFYGW